MHGDVRDGSVGANGTNVDDWGRGSELVVFSAFCIIGGVWRQITPEIARPTPEARELPAWALAIFTLLMLLVCLAALVGIWWEH